MNQKDWQASWKLPAGSAGTLRQIRATSSSSALRVGFGQEAACFSASSAKRAAKRMTARQQVTTAVRKWHFFRSPASATFSLALAASASAMIPFSPFSRTFQ